MFYVVDITRADDMSKTHSACITIRYKDLKKYQRTGNSVLIHVFDSEDSVTEFFTIREFVDIIDRTSVNIIGVKKYYFDDSNKDYIEVKIQRPSLMDLVKLESIESFDEYFNPYLFPNYEHKKLTYIYFKDTGFLYYIKNGEVNSTIISNTIRRDLYKKYRNYLLGHDDNVFEGLILYIRDITPKNRIVFLAGSCIKEGCRMWGDEDSNIIRNDRLGSICLNTVDDLIRYHKGDKYIDPYRPCLYDSYYNIQGLLITENKVVIDTLTNRFTYSYSPDLPKYFIKRRLEGFQF